MLTLTPKQAAVLLATVVSFVVAGMATSIWADYQQLRKDLVALQIDVGILKASQALKPASATSVPQRGPL